MMTGEVGVLFHRMVWDVEGQTSVEKRVVPPRFATPMVARHSETSLRQHFTKVYLLNPLKHVVNVKKSIYKG